MCLYTLNKKPKIAEKDIIVYKWLTKDGHGPYYKVRNKQGKLLPFVKGYEYTEIDEVKINAHINIRKKKYYEINGGVFHAFINNDSVKSKYWITTFICYKMIIPKGTEYWVSIDNTQVASKTLIFPKR